MVAQHTMLYPSSRFRIVALFFALMPSPCFVKSTCINTPAACGAGCWNEDNLVTSSGLRVCTPVGQGYYSPIHSNERFLCGPGTASSNPEAAACTPCEPGSYSSGRSFSGGGATTCTLCPSGFYQDKYGAALCFFCDLGLYDGNGSKGVTADGLCFLEKPSESPSSAPSKDASTAPSVAPSLMSSLTILVPRSESPSSAPSKDASTVPSVAPSLSPSLTILAPLADQCAHCPSVPRSSVLVVLLAVCVLATYLLLMGPFGSVVLLKVRSMLLLVVIPFRSCKNWLSAKTSSNKRFTETVLPVDLEGRVGEEVA